MTIRGSFEGSRRLRALSFVFQRAGLAISGKRAVDQPRIARVESRVIDAEPQGN